MYQEGAEVAPDTSGREFGPFAGIGASVCVDLNLGLVWFQLPDFAPAGLGRRLGCLWARGEGCREVSGW